MFIISELFGVCDIIYAMCSIINSFLNQPIFFKFNGAKTPTYDTSPIIRKTHTLSLNGVVSFKNYYLLVNISP